MKHNPDTNDTTNDQECGDDAPNDESHNEVDPNEYVRKHIIAQNRHWNLVDKYQQKLNLTSSAETIRRLIVEFDQIHSDDGESIYDVFAKELAKIDNRTRKIEESLKTVLESEFRIDQNSHNGEDDGQDEEDPSQFTSEKASLPIEVQVQQAILDNDPLTFNEIVFKVDEAPSKIKDAIEGCVESQEIEKNPESGKYRLLPKIAKEVNSNDE